MRRESPTCGAASPTPGAAYMVCTMLSIKPLRLPSIVLDRLGRFLEHGVRKFANFKQRHLL